MEAEIYLRAQELAEANKKLREANAELAGLYEKTKKLGQLKTQFFAKVSPVAPHPAGFDAGAHGKTAGREWTN